MPRNGSGEYTLPAGNPVVAGTTIDATWANDTLSDLANEITNSLSRTGAGGMLAPFRIADGSAAGPGLSFLNETNSGIYRASAGTLWLVVLGTPIAQITQTGMLLPTGKNLTVQGNGSVSGTFSASGAATLGSTLAVTGVITATAGVAGNVTGDVTSTGASTFEAVTINATLDMTNGVISNLATPVADGDAANKAYVDNLVQGLDAKASSVAATTANISLSGTQTIDGVAVTAGQRVLVKDQNSAAENGIYVVSAGAWTRASDANTWDELVSAYTFVEGGTTNGNNGFICTIAAGGTLGVTAVTWTQFSGAGQITAGAGLTKSGNTLNVGTASASRIVVNADNIDLATTGVSASTYRSVTVDVYGRVTAGTNPTTLAGYGITDAYTTTYIDTLFGTTNSAAVSATNAANSASAASTSASAAATSASTALGYLNTFRGQYIGASATDPTVDGNGAALTAGDLYFNTASNEMRVYNGSAWVAAYLPAAGYAALASANTFTANQTISANTSSDALKITQTGSGNAIYVEDVAADTTPFVVSSTGVVGIGTTTPDNVTSAGIALVSNDGYYPQLVTRNKTADANASYVVFDKDRAGAIVQNGDVLGNLIFRAYDGSNYDQAAAIMALVDGAPGLNDTPGALSFLTTADGAAAPTERLRINNKGALGVGGANYGTAGQVLVSQGAGLTPVWGAKQDTLVSGTNIKTINSTSLLGSGDITVGSSITRSARTSNTILGVADKGSLIDITSGTFTQTFTAAATLGNGWFAYVSNSGTGFVTLDPDASETITRDGVAHTTWVLWPNEACLLVCNGTGFFYTNLQKGEITQTVSSGVASVSFATGLAYRRKMALAWSNMDLSANDQVALYLNTSTSAGASAHIRFDGGTVSSGTGANDNFTLSNSVDGTPLGNDFRMRGSGVFSLSPVSVEFSGESWYYGASARHWGVYESYWSSVSESTITNITIKPNSANIDEGTFILREL